MSLSTSKGLAPSEVSYLLEARIRGVDPNRLTAVRFGQQGEEYLHPPAPLNRCHNPFGPDFCLSELPIGARNS